ncbi:cytochrome c5 family protein [Simiduia sp. 21SJ11W-1]|uniref:c-type cytochrome n=1 Tax=Simiduia sp. 21SJ11W-1 TaxID=2909669 RepID=UPI00273A6545|nr:c-type cytochrome [Simiduia sp. 21SJ11W-1]
MVTLADRSQEIADRIAPAGKTCLAGDDCAAAPVAAVAAGPRTGVQVYDTKCVTCHATGAAGAPKMGDAGQWAPRIGKGIDTLYANAINGINGMPAKGLCMDCSDDEIKAAVDHMVANSQ